MNTIERILQSMTIKSLVVTPMASPGQQYRRSLDAQVTTDNVEKLRLFSTDIAKHRHLSFMGDEFHPTTPVSVLAEFAKLSNKAIPVTLPTADGKSWDSKLASFILEIQYTKSLPEYPVTAYLTGYISNTVGDFPAEGEPFDPDTEFTINSIYEFQNRLEVTPDGPKRFSEMKSAVQVLCNSGFSGIDNAATQKRLCPYEVVTQIGSTGFLATMGPGEVYDTRMIQTHYPSFANYKENDPTVWAQSLLEANVTTVIDVANDPSPHGLSEEGYYHHMSRQVRTPPSTNQAVLYCLGKLTDGTLRNHFTLKDLCLLDEKFTGQPLALRKQEEHDLTRFRSMDGGTYNSICGSYLANSVSALMAKHGIRNIGFGADNFDYPGKVVVSLVDGIHQSLSPEEVEKFVTELKDRVIAPLTFQGKVSYIIHGRFDLFGNSLFSFEMNGQGFCQFISPTFANAVFSPQITTEENVLEEIAHAFSAVFQHYKENIFY